MLIRNSIVFVKNVYTLTGGAVTALTAGCVTAATGCTQATSLTTSPVNMCTMTANQNAIFACYSGASNQITTTTASTWAAIVCPPSTKSFCSVS